MDKFLNLFTLARVPAFLWLAGFLCALMPFKAYEAEFFGTAIMLIATGFLVSLSQYPPLNLRRLFIRSHALGVLVFVFWLIAFLSVCFSEIPSVSFIYFCLFSALPLGFFIAKLQINKNGFFKIVTLGVGVVLSIVSTFAVVQYFFLPDMLVKGLVQVPLSNPNSLAALLSFGVFGGVGGVFVLNRPVFKRVSFAVAGLCFSALLTTGSRGAFVALCAGLVLFFAMNYRRVLRHIRVFGAFVIVVVLTFVAFTYLSPSVQTPGEVLIKTLGGDMPVLWSRPQIWAATMEIIREHIWTGTGIGTFFLYYPSLRGDEVISAGLSAHSDPLQFASDMGVLAPIVFYLLMIVIVWQTFSVLRRLKNNETERIYISIAFCALGAMALHTHITFNFYVLPVLFISGVTLAFLQAHIVSARVISGKDVPKIVSKMPARHPHLKWATSAVVALMAIALTYGFARLQGSYVMVSEARTAMRAGDLERFSDKINTAHHLSGGYNANAYVLAASHLLSEVELAQTHGVDRERIRVAYDDGLMFLDKARALNPRLASAPFAQARFIMAIRRLGMDDARPEKPIDLLSLAYDLDPTHVGVQVMLSDYYLNKYQHDKALDILKKGLRWTYRNQDPSILYRKTAWLALQRGDTETYEQALTKLTPYRARIPSGT